MPNKINTKARAKEIHELWICHYGTLVDSSAVKMFRSAIGVE